MLFRLVRPVKRSGSRYHQYIRRIPSDVRSRAKGLALAVPVGDEVQSLVISANAQAIRLSLRTDQPADVKLRLAQVDAFFENVWEALRQTDPVSLTHRQATALGGDVYRAWVACEEPETTTAIEHDPHFLIPEDHITERGEDGKIAPGPWRRTPAHHVPSEHWEAVETLLKRLEESGAPSELERTFGGLADHLLLSRGILRVDEPSRDLVMQAVVQALRDAFALRRRNAEGNYSPDPKAPRFPEWQPQEHKKNASAKSPKASLKGLVESWWVEAKARGLKPSTYESYRNTMTSFVQFLKHDDAKRVTREDVVRFKDHRLATVNPRTKTPISAKTIKDSDLAGLKTVFGWAKVNGKLASNPAEGVTIKLGKVRKLRSKGFTDREAEAILTAALALKLGNENLKTFAAKKWVPWLCAYSGGRVGELAQIRKEDVRKHGIHWILTITPEAGTVKTNEAREVVLHEHLQELGFIDFVKSSAEGHLFLTSSFKGDVLGPLQGVKNRIGEFVRTIVTDKNVAPSHGWRHRFKSVGIEAGIEHRILDAIQGHRPRNVAEGYGEVSIKAQASAIKKMPRYLGQICS